MTFLNIQRRIDCVGGGGRISRDDYRNRLLLDLIGCWIGLTTDSLFRASSLVFLWRKGKWRESHLT